MFGLALDTLPAFVVILNALVRGINTDNNPDSLVWLVLEICFLVVFLLEFVILCGTEVDCVVQKSIVYYKS